MLVAVMLCYPTETYRRASRNHDITSSALKRQYFPTRYPGICFWDRLRVCP